MTQPFTLAHLSDPHLAPIQGLHLRYLNAKRLLGLANWVRKRRRLHQMSLLAQLVADLKHQSPDHIAVTGDLANLGLPAEHEHALAWLAELGNPRNVSVIPGNHDIYSTIGNDPGTGRWSAYMASQPVRQDVAGTEPAGFPYLRRFDQVVLIGLCSAVPTPPFRAGGRLGDTQRATARALLEDLGRDGAFRVVLIHHPPLPGQASLHKALEDAEQMQDLLRNSGAELVLHGHNHRAMHTRVPRAGAADVEVLGVPSASQDDARAFARAQYNLYRIEKTPAGWRVEMTSRGVDATGARVVELGRTLLRAG